MVVIRHASARVAEVYPHAGWLDWTMGSAGVNIFFVISGFIMVHITNEDTTTTPLQFWSKRLIRIVPIYWACTLLAFAATKIVPAYFFGNASFQNLATSLFFVPDLLPRGKLSPVLVVGWTLNLEMPFYMLMAGCLAFGRSYLLATIGALFTVFLLANSLTSLGYFPRFYAGSVWLEFGLGIFLAVLLKRSSAIPPWVGIVSAAIGFAFIAWLWRGHKVPADELISGGIPACLIVAGFVIAEPYFKGRWLQPLVLLGDASYAIYVVHLLLLNPLARAGFDNPAGLLATMGDWIFFGVMLSGGLTLGLLTHLSFERPVGKMLRRFVPVSARRPTLATAT